MSFSRDDTQKKVIHIIAEKLKMSPDQIKEGASFKELGADSLDTVEMIMNFEETFGIEIRDEDAEKIITVAQAVDHIHTLRTK